MRKKFERYRNGLTDELIQAINGKDINRINLFNKTEVLKGVNEEIVLMILYCLQPLVRSKITIFNLNNGYKLPEMILQSICRSKVSFQLNGRSR